MSETMKCVFGNIYFIYRYISEEYVCEREKDVSESQRKQFGPAFHYIYKAQHTLVIICRRGGNVVLLVFPNAKQVSLPLGLIVAVFQQNENAGIQDILAELVWQNTSITLYRK